MRRYLSGEFTNLFVLGCFVLVLSCSPTSRDYSDVSDATGGATIGTGGKSSSTKGTGGKSLSTTAKGGNGSTTGGTTASSQTGGATPGDTSTGGTNSTSTDGPSSTSTGGLSSTGALSSTGGTTSTSTGPIVCSMHSDCAELNPDSYSCLAKCVAGKCKVEADPTLISTVTGTLNGNDVPVTGLWNATTPYLVYAPIRQTNETNNAIAFQQLRGDKTSNGAEILFTLPATTLSVSHLSAILRNGTVGLLWHGTKGLGTSTPDYALQFAETDLLGNEAIPRTVASSTVGTNYPEDASAIFLVPTGDSNYGMLKFGGTPDSWKGYAGSPATASMTSTPLNNSPVDVDSSKSFLGNTIFVTGRNCSYMSGACPKQLTLQRYSVTDLSSIGENTQLSSSAYDSNDVAARTFSPAMGVVGSNMVLFWNENGTDGLQLVRATLSEAGVYQGNTPVSTVSGLMPKAVVGFAGGGGVLFAARANTASTNVYELVAHRFDAALNLVGQAYTLTNPREGLPTEVEAHADSTGTRVLVTLRHGGFSQFTLLHAGLCQ